MSELDIGMQAPDFTLPGQNGTEITLSALTGNPVVLFFYPKDDTPGCTLEAQDFTGLAADFAAIGAKLFGISKDSLARHDKFIAKYGLEVPLLSDEHNDVCEAYGVWKEKNMYGRKYFGIERSTFLIGSDGKFARIWRKVKVAGHAEEVLAEAKAL